MRRSKGSPRSGEPTEEDANGLPFAENVGAATFIRCIMRRQVSVGWRLPSSDAVSSYCNKHCSNPVVECMSSALRWSCGFSAGGERRRSLAMPIRASDRATMTWSYFAACDITGCRRKSGSMLRNHAFDSGCQNSANLRAATTWVGSVGFVVVAFLEPVSMFCRSTQASRLDEVTSDEEAREFRMQASAESRTRQVSGSHHFWIPCFGTFHVEKCLTSTLVGIVS